MEHRGACGGDGVSGDGAGVMTSVPWELFEAEGMLKGKPAASCGVAMFFLPQDAGERATAERLPRRCKNTLFRAHRPQHLGQEVLAFRAKRHGAIL